MIFRQDRFQRGGDHTPFLNQGFPAVRLTTSPLWERETWVGNVTTYTMPDVSIDDVVIGVKAVDRDGHQSIVPPYLEPVLPAMLTPAGANERTCILPLTCATLTGFPVHKFPSHMRVRILYHDHCFDGAASAAFFTRFVQARFYPGAEFSYTGLAHKASQLFEPELFDGDVNAIVDFKYSTDPRLTWWFDHHQSAFLTPEDAAHFRLDTSGKKMYDTSFRSCTNYIATIAREKFGFEADDLKELVTWAEIVDGAQYADAQEAVELRSPATQLTLTIEGSHGSETVQKIIGMMRHQSLAEIAADPQIQAIYKPLYGRHLRSMDIIRERSVCDRGVIFFDLVSEGVDGYNKFIPYYLHPDSIYTVSVTSSTFRTKVSVGSNPWVKEPLKFNLASICERYGGGGHAKVGAISFEIGAIEQARAVAAEIAAELRG